MPNPFLTNQALTQFINGLKVNDAQKSSLLAKVPELDEDERKKLFDVLKGVYFLDMEEQEALAKVQKYWQK